mgnify:CR=1 FL=1
MSIAQGVKLTSLEVRIGEQEAKINALIALVEQLAKEIDDLKRRSREQNGRR